jgi:hypothetical protein
MTVLDFLTAIDGVAQLYAADGQFLGVLSSNQYDLNSIFNPNGIYGSTWGIFSIRNPSSLYGSSYGIYSPYNPNSLNPPIIRIPRSICAGSDQKSARSHQRLATCRSRFDAECV